MLEIAHAPHKDQEHCAARNTLRQRFWCGASRTEWRSHCFVRMNLINIALMLTGHVIQRTYREAVFDGAVENDNATTRGLVLSLAHRLSCHGHRLLDCHPLGSMVSPHAGMMSDTPY